MLEGPIAGSITNSFELYWTSEWVTKPSDINANAEAPLTNDLLGKLSGAEQALLTELQQHTSEHTTSTCNDMQFVTDYPGSGVERRRVFLAISELAQEAQREITVESPYLVFREDGVAVLKSVVQKGVKVRFLTNSLNSTDAFYTVASLASSLEPLRMPNLEVWAYQGQPLAKATRAPASPRWGVHSKRAVFDDDTVAVGTYNIDPRSANLNSELIVICRGNVKLARAMKANIQARLVQSIPILGTPQAGGEQALIHGADDDAVWRMRAIAPFARLLDFLM